ncbi:succinate dehydrogenase cytochrome b560 subunit, mitochondrial-like [Aricia agestis]|uniref:succinate dehydrogenase cytochrome b560 subunit, mitochondrial-like n=1 Tax=Aricia agestis TaxID=91739 RepID=UPI001C206A8F|nr:succinate dehydrogenase cytochrome b560 subunit, mitochondrial-like [Aricia agestis]
MSYLIKIMRHCTSSMWSKSGLLAPVQFSVIKRYECNTPSRHGVTYEQYKKPPPMSHDEKNMCLNRPMSPHVTIYAPTLPAMTSIVQRATGIMLYGYALLLAGGALFLPNGIETYVSMIQSLDLSENCILAARMLIAAPFMYHYFIGLRFIMWNAGKLLSMKQIYATAWVSILAAIIGTVCGAYYTV